MKKKTKKGVRCGQIIGLASWEMERDREQKVGDGMWPFHNGISIVWPMEANQQKPEKMLILSEWKYYLKCSSSCEKFRILLSCFICIFEAESFSWKALQATEKCSKVFLRLGSVRYCNIHRVCQSQSCAGVCHEKVLRIYFLRRNLVILFPPIIGHNLGFTPFHKNVFLWVGQRKIFNMYIYKSVFVYSVATGYVIIQR